MYKATTNSAEINPSFWNKFIVDRFQESRQITLGLKQIFVLPTLSAGALLVTISILLLMAINFQSSLIYGLGFWLLAVIVINIFFTYRNLSGLTFKFIKASPCFAGEKAVFEIEVSCLDKKQKSAISIGWKDQDLVKIDLKENNSIKIKLSHTTKKRGLFKPERITVFTVYPINLIIAWSYAMLKMHSVVFPEPIPQKIEEDGSKIVDDEANEGKEITNGTTDFSGVREYQKGDSPKHIHWGAYAKTGKAYTKTFIDYSNQDMWLDWDAIVNANVELKLSHLCAKILECEQEQQVYGLKIPNVTIEPSSGELHKNQCLTALAMYGNS